MILLYRIFSVSLHRFSHSCTLGGIRTVNRRLEMEHFSMILINGSIIISYQEDLNKLFTLLLKDGTRFIGVIGAKFLLIFL